MTPSWPAAAGTYTSPSYTESSTTGPCRPRQPTLPLWNTVRLGAGRARCLFFVAKTQYDWMQAGRPSRPQLHPEDLGRDILWVCPILVDRKAAMRVTPEPVCFSLRRHRLKTAMLGETSLNGCSPLTTRFAWQTFP